MKNKQNIKQKIQELGHKPWRPGALAMLAPALFAPPQAGSQEFFCEVFRLSTSLCPRAPCPGEAVLKGSFYPPH